MSLFEQGCHQEPLVQPREGRTHIRPSVEFVPGEVEVRERRLRKRLELEPRADAIEDFPEQNI
jgi:hypothetical protein